MQKLEFSTIRCSNNFFICSSHISPYCIYVKNIPATKTARVANTFLPEPPVPSSIQCPEEKRIVRTILTIWLIYIEKNNFNSNI